MLTRENCPLSYSNRLALIQELMIFFILQSPSDGAVVFSGCGTSGRIGFITSVIRYFHPHTTPPHTTQHHLTPDPPPPPHTHTSTHHSHDIFTFNLLNLNICKRHLKPFLFFQDKTGSHFMLNINIYNANNQGSEKQSYTNKNEPQRQKTYLRTCAPSEDSDQPAHSSSLVRIYTGRIWGAKMATFLHVDNEDSD